MTKALTKSTSKAIFSFEGTMVENMKMAEMLAVSSLVPKDYQNQPGNVIVAVQMGQELGLKPMQSLQGIAVINGRPCVWGDALIGLVRGSKHCEFITESFDHETMTATCTAKRFDEAAKTTTFSKEDAIQAGLWSENKKVYSFKAKKDVDNTSPWHRYPKRMLQMRARGFCLRDLFPDVLKGLSVAEEQQDIHELKQVNEAPAKSAKASKVADFINNAEPVVVEETGEVLEGETIRFDKADLLNKIELSQSPQELAGLAVELGQAPEEFKPELRKAYGVRSSQFQKGA